MSPMRIRLPSLEVHEGDHGAPDVPKLTCEECETAEWRLDVYEVQPTEPRSPWIHILTCRKCGNQVRIDVDLVEIRLPPESGTEFVDSILARNVPGARATDVDVFVRSKAVLRELWCIALPSGHLMANHAANSETRAIASFLLEEEEIKRRCGCGQMTWSSYFADGFRCVRLGEIEPWQVAE